jgi:hypothetical protein
MLLCAATGLIAVPPGNCVLGQPSIIDGEEETERQTSG